MPDDETKRGAGDTAGDGKVGAFTHDAERRANIPPAELEPVLHPEDRETIRAAYKRRNPDLDPQLVWRGKDVADWSDVVVDAPPIYLQEQIHPKALIENLRRRARAGDGGSGSGPSLFDHFGVTEEDAEAEVEFYRHSKRWSNRMILGDALPVMASLAEREGLKGQVQAIYIDPPYGIRFNSNFQWSTTSRDVKDGKLEHLTREPEQVKAFRDTWRDGIHSYLTYLRDRLTVARELLTESGSCFVQIGDENVHRVRALMDEVFGDENFVSSIVLQKTAAQGHQIINNVTDHIIWFARNKEKLKSRTSYAPRRPDPENVGPYSKVLRADLSVVSLNSLGGFSGLSKTDRLYRRDNISSSGYGGNTVFPVTWNGTRYRPSTNMHWSTHSNGMERLNRARRMEGSQTSLSYVRYFGDFPFSPRPNVWTDVSTGGFTDRKTYVVQTVSKIIQRCLLMTTDPGDLVLDPTCGSGTTAYVAEQWGRRWITVDTSRVALALARARIMGAKYPWYILADSPEGQAKEAELSRTAPPDVATHNDIRHGFVYQRVPHITLKSIANNAEIDEIWARMQPAVEAALADLNAALQADPPAPVTVQTGGRKGQKIDFTAPGTVTLPSGEPAPAGGLMEWEVPRGTDHGTDAIPTQYRRDTDADVTALWPPAARDALARFWEARIARQREIDASIAARAEHEYLYDKPYEDRKKVRVSGPFTVESLSPHRSAALDEHGDLIDEAQAAAGDRARESRETATYTEAILENLRKSGVHQKDKGDRITFDTLRPWPGEWISAEGRYREGDVERRAGIFIGPEYGTVQRADLVACAREAADAGLDIAIACAFNFDAHAADVKIGRMRVLQARMNPDLHMAGELKAGGGNLFVVFGEPDVEVIPEGDRLRVRIRGVDIFKPQTGEVVSTEAEDIACWFIDTDYSGESFFVRHAYFPGAEVPYKALKSTLRAEIDEDAWESLKAVESRPFPRPASGRIAVKVINHLGDEVMKVFGV